LVSQASPVEVSPDFDIASLDSGLPLSEREVKVIELHDNDIVGCPFKFPSERGLSGSTASVNADEQRPLSPGYSAQQREQLVGGGDRFSQDTIVDPDSCGESAFARPSY